MNLTRCTAQQADGLSKARKILKRKYGSVSAARAEREALSLIHFLRDRGKPQPERLDAIAADQTPSEPVRQRALQFAREWK